MLYGMDEYEELNLIKRPKLNKKKVAIAIIIVFLSIVCIINIIKRLTKKQDDYAQDNFERIESIFSENDQDNTLENQLLIAEENEIDNKQEIINDEIANLNESEENIDDSVENAYEGNHIQIASHDIEKIKQNFVPKFNENAPQLIKEIYSSQEKQVFLTFDDGPSKDITPRILDILRENNIKATFFVLGSRVELYPDILKRENEEGHYIANHGYSHKYSQIYQNKDTVFQEYIDCENSIKKALNNQDYNTYLFRFPGGSSGGSYEKIKAEARNLFNSYGIAFTNWNCLTGDAENKKTKEACMQEMLNTKGNKNSIILLMHDANDKTQTAEVLPEIIQYYKNEGYTFKNFYEIF